MPTTTPQPEAGSIVKLVLLNTFRLEIDGRTIRLPSAAQRLVALLGLEMHPISRSRLAGLLWPESPQGQARTNLRQVLWRLHGATLDHLPIDYDADLCLAAGVDCDAARLHREAHLLLGDGREPGPDSVLGHGDGELLPDWDDAWVVSERQRLQQLRLHALEAWAETLTRAGRFGLALERAMLALASDPLRESAHRAVIRIHLAEGNHAEAQRCLDRCRTILAAELGVAPAAETERLLDGSGVAVPAVAAWHD